MQKALSDDELRRTMTQSYESAKECLEINYHGAKRTFECLLPLLQLSDSPRVVNVSATLGKIEVIQLFFYVLFHLIKLALSLIFIY